jgi:hypothetical protein
LKSGIFLWQSCELTGLNTMNMTRSYTSADARVLVKSTKKVAAVHEEVVAITQLAADHCFQPGDIVSFRSNTPGIVLSATGNGVQVGSASSPLH